MANHQKILLFSALIALGLVAGYRASRAQEQTSGKPFEGAPTEVQSCLEGAYGKNHYNNLREGKTVFDNATDGDLAARSGCFKREIAVGENVTVKAEPIDPFANMDATHLDCLNGAVGEDGVKSLRDGGAFNQEYKSKIDAAGCFEKGHQGKQGSEQFTLPKDIEDCIASKIPKETLEAVKTGKQEKTPGMEDELRPCFEQFGKDKYITRYDKSEVSSAVEKCAGAKIDAEHLRKLKTGEESPNEADRKAFQTCMGESSNPAAPTITHRMPAKLEACLNDKIGDQTFAKISSGRLEPDVGLKAKGDECFKQFEAKKSDIETKKVLPPDPKEVLFIPEDKKVTIGEVKATAEAVNLTGAVEGAKKDELVDITIYSENPKQIQATVGDSGFWTVAYDGSLADGEHKVYVVARRAGQLLRSTAKTFTVGQAQAQTTQQTTLSVAAPYASQTQTPAQTKPTRGFLFYYFYGVGAVAVAGGVAGAVWWFNKRRVVN